MPDPTDAEAAAELAQANLVITDPEVSKRAGRPSGLPKTGGRVRGTPNKVNAISRDFIISRGAPIEVLCKIAKVSGHTERKSSSPTSLFVTFDLTARATP